MGDHIIVRIEKKKGEDPMVPAVVSVWVLMPYVSDVGVDCFEFV